MRVNVSLSGKKYVGVVWSVGGVPAIDEGKIQDIDSVASDIPSISVEEIRFWKFISSYYLCTPGEVYKAAYPFSRIQSEETLARIRESRRVREEKMRLALLARAQKQAAKLEKKGLDVPEDILDIIRNEGRKVQESRGLEPRRDGMRQPADPGLPVLYVAASRVERYVSKVRSCLVSGRSVLLLIPEIAISERLQKVFEEEFGASVRLYNSRQTARQRRDTAEALRDVTSPELIIGSRCAVFLPFRDLGLIIVDEEQDQSYKQTEPNPRINARDAAVVLGNIHGAEVILGSSAPSLESLLNCKLGKYVLEGGVGKTEIPIIDISAERRKRGMVGMFSRKLIAAAEQAGDDIALIRGWEKTDELDEEIQTLFPEKNVNVFTAKEALRLPDSEIRRLDLVAILQADALFPKADFRADERAFQLIRRLITSFPEKQLAIQTAKSGHPVFKALKGGYDVEAILEERRAFNLPPYSRAVDVTIRDNAPKRLGYLSALLADVASKALGKVAGNPAPNAMETQFSLSPMTIAEESGITLRWLFPRAEAEKKKSALLETVATFEKDKKYTGHIHIDVDPV